MAKEEQIKTSIDLTGEKEYRAACTNINSSLREIGSEMKLTTAEFADNADSVEALTAFQPTRPLRGATAKVYKSLCTFLR